MEIFKENKRLCKAVAIFKLLSLENMALGAQDSSESFLWLIYEFQSAVDSSWLGEIISQPELRVLYQRAVKYQVVAQCPVSTVYRFWSFTGSGLYSGTIIQKKNLPAELDDV